jgi:hypothetical protein
MNSGNDLGLGSRRLRLLTPITTRQQSQEPEQTTGDDIAQRPEHSQPRCPPPDRVGDGTDRSARWNQFPHPHAIRDWPVYRLVTAAAEATAITLRSAGRLDAAQEIFIRE